MCNYNSILREKGSQVPVCNREGTIYVDRPDLEPNKIYKMTDNTTCTICSVCEGALFQTKLKVDKGDGTTVVPIGTVRPVADRFVVSLVAIRQDRHYLPKSLVFTIYKQPAFVGFRTNFTKFIIKKTQHLTNEEYNQARQSRPRTTAEGRPWGTPTSS